MAGGVSGGTFEAAAEALRAARSAFGLTFETAHGFEPCLVVIIVIDDFETDSFGIAPDLSFPQFILLQGG